MIVFVVLLVMLFGGGCAYRGSVLFVTKTSLGIDVDSKPPSASIAYDRVEGFLGPRYDNGGVPPVVGRLQTDGAVFNPRVRQLYATGSAAALVADQNASAGPTELKGEKMFMFFGTTTSTGLKVTFMGQYPDSFHIGYRRKEFSFIPLGHTKNSAGEDVDVYPSVLATLDNRLEVGTNPVGGPTSGLQVGQLFATGIAADEYARNPVVRQLFQDEVTDALAAYRTAVSSQDAEAKRILRCYLGVPFDKLPAVWKEANDRGLFRDATSLADMTTWYQAAQAAGTPAERESNLLKANRQYASEIDISVGSEPVRLQRLAQHRQTVCQAARTP